MHSTAWGAPPACCPPQAGTGVSAHLLAPTPPPLQALASPLSGVLGDRFDRAYVVAAGCALWGVMTAAIGLSQTLGQAMLFCAGAHWLPLLLPLLTALPWPLHPACIA